MQVYKNSKTLYYNSSRSNQSCTRLQEDTLIVFILLCQLYHMAGQSVNSCVQKFLVFVVEL